MIEITHTNDRPCERAFLPVLRCAPVSSLTTDCTLAEAIATAEHARPTERDDSPTLQSIRAAGVILYRGGEFGAFAPGGGFVGCTESAAEAQRLIDAAKAGTL